MFRATGNLHSAQTPLSMALVLIIFISLSQAAIAHHRPGHGGGGGGGGGGGEDTWSFHAESVGHVIGFYDSKETNVSGDVHNLVFNKPGGNAFWLGDYFVARDYAGRSGEECFVNSGIDRAGTMQLYDGFGSDSNLVAKFWFWAENDPDDPGDKLDDIQYVLSLYNYSNNWDGPFPPDQGVYSNRTATHWSLSVRRGARRNEPCVSNAIEAFSSGTVDFGVLQNP